MRNLIRLRTSHQPFSLPTSPDAAKEYRWSLFSSDASRRVYVAGYAALIDPSEESDDSIPLGPLVVSVPSTNLTALNRTQTNASESDYNILFDSLCECDPPLASNAKPILVRFLPDHSALCFVCDSGHIFLIPMQLPGFLNEVDADPSSQIECVGHVEDGLAAASWSPDGELLVLISCTGNILLMTASWDVLAESKVSPSGDESNEKRFLHNHSSVCWRGDGKYFVCSALDRKTCHRAISVYDRDGKKQSTCENTAKVESPLAWRPSGSLIASTEKQPSGKYFVVFFERNGLRHGEITLPFNSSEAEVIQIGWNIESDIIAVLSKKNTQHILQLYTMSNYHWYLKQEFIYESIPGAVFSWHEEKSYFITLLVPDGHIFEYEFAWDTTISGGPEATNFSTAAVIDGDRLLLTPLRRTVVPPPMSSTVLKTPSPIQAADFLDSSEIACLLSDGRVVITNPYSITTRGGYFDATAPPSIKAILVIPDISPSSVKQVIWGSAEKLYFLCRSVDSSVDELKIAQLQTNAEIVSISNVSTTKLQTRAIKIHQDKVNKQIIVEAEDGHLFLVLEDESHSLRQIGKFPSPCSTIASTVIGGKVVVFGLNERYTLYSGEQLISSECNSFFIHDQFLVFTTLRHIMQMIPTNGNWPPENFLPDNQDYHRSVERGSKIVAAVPYDVKVVLQMPRGNLEGISPRAILIQHICKMLDQKLYSKAFMEMRRQRVDLNLIYDYDPVTFAHDVDEIVAQISNVDYINLLISSMRDEDTMPTMFPTVKAKSTPQYPGKNEKVNHICDILRSSLVRRGTNKYFLSIITAMAKRSPPLMEDALEMIRQRRDTPAENSEQELDQPSAEEALDYAIFLVDVNKLYDVALGMYDFDLVKMVAQKSSKDPKEYLPFLADLQKLEPLLQKYTIDKGLKKFESALKHISQAGEEHFEKCVELIQQHELYRLGLKLFESDKEKHQKVMHLYAEYLSLANRHDEAGFAFIQAKDERKALSSFVSAGLVNYTFSTVSRLQLSQSEKTEIAYTISDVLKNSGRHLEAANVLVDYCQDADEAITILIDGRLWEDSLNLACRSDREDLIETTIISGLDDGYGTIISEIKENITRYEKYYGRLNEIRGNRSLSRVTVDDEDDTQSEAASEVGSLWSGYSSRLSVVSTASTSSSRSTKKARQRSKKTKFRDGSVEEDAYLIKLLSQTVPTTKYIDECIGLCRTLIYFGKLTHAKEVKEQLDTFLSFLRDRIPSLSDAGQDIPLEGVTFPPIPTASWNIALLE